MTRLPCRYAIVQFLPFAETGEFANVGIVLACPATGYMSFQLQTKRWGRVTAFFEEVQSATYRSAIKAFGAELERVRLVIANLPDNHLRADAVRVQFEALTHPREAIFRFSQPRALMAADPKAALAELFQHYVERSFATPEYVERNITKRVQLLLRNATLKAPFRQDRVGNDEVHASFPLVQKVESVTTRIIKPFNLSQDAPNDILEHGSAWVSKLRHLNKRHLLPRDVLFAVQAPPALERKRFAVFREVCEELAEQRVQVVDQADDREILAFASA